MHVVSFRGYQLWLPRGLLFGPWRFGSNLSPTLKKRACEVYLHGFFEPPGGKKCYSVHTGLYAKRNQRLQSEYGHARGDLKHPRIPACYGVLFGKWIVVRILSYLTYFTNFRQHPSANSSKPTEERDTSWIAGTKQSLAIGDPIRLSSIPMGKRSATIVGIDISCYHTSEQIDAHRGGRYVLEGRKPPKLKQLCQLT